MTTTPNSVEQPPEAEIPKVSGRMCSTSLMLTVLAFAAPIAVVTGFIPLTIIFSGPGAVGSLIATTILLIVFSVGFVAMTKTVRRPGAFYSYASVGLGKVTGLGSAFLAAAGYFIILVGAYVYIGLLVHDAIRSFGASEDRRRRGRFGRSRYGWSSRRSDTCTSTSRRKSWSS